MSDAATIGGIIGCLLFCPSEGLPLQAYEPLPSVAGTPYDCRLAIPRLGPQNTWVGRFIGRSDFDDYGERTMAVTGCFPSERECVAFLNRLDGLAFGHITQRTCRRGA